MRTRSTHLAVLAAAALLAACAPDAPVGPSSLAPGDAIAAAKAKPVPFRAKVSGSVTIGTGPTDCPDGTVGASATGGGTASHLGRFTIVSQTACLNADGTGGTQGEFVWRAANGDLLTGTFTFTSNPPDANGTVTLTSLEGEITGGTGRFADATGTLELDQGVFQFRSPTEFTFNVGVKGDIRY